MKMKAVLISPGYTMLDDSIVCSTPDNTYSAGLGPVLDRVAAKMVGEGVLFLDGPSARAFRLPSSTAEKTDEGLNSARAHGWKVDKHSAWTTFYADGRPTVVLATLPMIEPNRFPLMNPRWSQDTVASTALWQELAGSAWRGTPGVAGMALMRALAPRVTIAGRTNPTPPTWKPTRTGPDDAHETDFSVRSWTRVSSGGFEHGYDATRMYLAAAGACELLSPWALKHTPQRRTFDPKVAGWWRVELAPWNDSRIPHPAGPGAPIVRWITTPTAVLLTELADLGVYGGFEVLESWTGTGKRLLRAWGERIEHVYQRAAELTADLDSDGTPSARAQDAARVRSAAKEVYRESWGLLNRPQNSVYRPDWHYTILALARANLWRKVWKVGRTEDRWPLRIDVDNVWYEHGDPDPIVACPKGFTLGDRLGQFKTKGTKAAA